MFGRASLNDIVVDEPGVSRQHAGIRGDAQGFTIADLGSRNGTFLNGERIGQEPQKLKNWDRITIGGMTSQIQWVFIWSHRPPLRCRVQTGPRRGKAGLAPSRRAGAERRPLPSPERLYSGEYLVGRED